MTNMSHFSKVSIRCNELEYIKKALNRMGIRFEEKNTSITAENQKADVQIKFDDCVGLARQQDGTYAMVGDVYYSKQSVLKQYYNYGQKFTADFSTAYSIEQSKGHLEEQGFICDENPEATVGQDHMIRQVYVRI